MRTGTQDIGGDESKRPSRGFRLSEWPLLGNYNRPIVGKAIAGDYLLSGGERNEKRKRIHDFSQNFPEIPRNLHRVPDLFQFLMSKKMRFRALFCGFWPRCRLNSNSQQEISTLTEHFRTPCPRIKSIPAKTSFPRRTFLSVHPKKWKSSCPYGQRWNGYPKAKSSEGLFWSIRRRG